MADLLRGRYEVLAVLSRERSTEVLRALDRQHGQTVVLRVSQVSVDRDRDALLDEARTLLALRPHPALPKARDDFFTEDCHVLVMDWIEGTNVGLLLADQGDPGLPAGTVLGWLPPIASAIDHLHRQVPPVVHGDIRPDNLVVGPDGTTAVVFGPAPLGSSAIEGHPGYSAPEMASGGTGGPAADVYALAATIVCLLTGRPPVEGATTAWEGLAPELAKRLDRVLRRALDPDPARRPASASELAERLDAAREGALPTGVVTFALTDMEGSTELWEAHPDVMVRVVARHHDLAAQATELFGGRMPRSQGEGDSTLSAFGRASDAVRAALEFQRALREEPWPKGIQLRVRAGLHTGEAQVEGGDYFGAAVSRTARVRGLARGGQVLLSRTTAELVTDRLPDGVSLHDLGRFELKGLARAEQIYELVTAGLTVTGDGTGDAATESGAPATRMGVAFPASLDTGTGEFVGRRASIAALAALWDQTRADSRRRLVLVGGEPGIGKTWTVAAFARLAAAGGATVLHGRCYQENLVPYQPFVDVVRHYVRTGPEPQVRADLAGNGSSLSRLAPDATLRFPDLPEPVQAEPDTERYLMFEAVNDLFERLAGYAPVLLVLDDLHWADRPTLALLEHVARNADPARILVVGTYRLGEVGPDNALTEAASDLRREQLVSEIVIGGMDGDEIGQLVAGTTQGTPDVDFVESVRRETDGNPFFVQEVLRHLAETGAPAGAFTLATLGVPEGVKQVIGRRVARLDEGVGQVLTAAAVIGRDFQLDLVVEVAGVTEDDAIDLLDEAAAARLVEETGVTGEYSFVHALTRETLHDALGPTRRARLHHRVAEAIEARRSSDLDDQLGALAYHYAMAGSNLAKAVEYAGRAGEQSLARLAHEEAAAQFERGLAALNSQDSARCDLLLGLAEARRRGGDVLGAQEAFVAAAALARSLRDPERLARAAIGNFRGHVLAHPSWHEPLIELLEEALAALPGDESGLRARVLGALALELHFTEQKARGTAIGAAGVEMARRVGDEAALAFALACSHVTLSDPAQAATRLAYATELVEVGARTGHPELELAGHVYRASDLLELARVDEARSEVKAAAAMVAELGQPMQRYFVIWLQSTLAVLEGRLADAEQFSLEAFDIGVAAQHPDAFVVRGSQAIVLAWQTGKVAALVEQARGLLDEFTDLPAWRAATAFIEALAGHEDEARGHLEHFAANFDELEYNSIWAPALVSLTEVCRIIDERGPVPEIYLRLSPFADRLCVVSLNVSEMGPISRALGVLASLRGDYEAATRHFDDALATSQRIGAPPHVARTHVDRARMLLARDRPGDAERARELLAEASTIAEPLGLGGLVADMDALTLTFSR
jgi:class 3 adenylate cyclase/tetratricopeptide (TPR) repeat protein